MQPCCDEGFTTQRRILDNLEAALLYDGQAPHLGFGLAVDVQMGEQAMRRLIIAPDHDTTMERRRHDATRWRWQPLLRSSRTLSSLPT
jgi:hypothetical protein